MTRRLKALAADFYGFIRRRSGHEEPVEPSADEKDFVRHSTDVLPESWRDL
jgi:hypothetical protein